MKESTMDPTKKLSLSWEAYERSICNGLGLLQQRGEFVDMTLAADGHHVKVHQMVMSLVSPFIKDLIKSANCQHPVIFLNRVSYSTMQSLLEYAYTGEVIVAPERLVNFLQACKDLHIHGLQDITVQGDGKDLLQLIGVKSAVDTDDPLRHSETPLRTGIKRRKKPKKEAPAVEYLHADDEMQDDEVHGDGIPDGDETYYDGDETHDEKLDDDTDNVEYSHNNENEDDFVEIDPYRAGSRWFCRDNNYYVISRTKGETVYLRCASDKCPAHWALSKKRGIGPIIDMHNHGPTPWIPNRNAMFQALKRRTQSENLPLNVIYEQEANRYPDAAPRLVFESVVPSMRKWRKSAQLMASRELQSMG